MSTRYPEREPRSKNQPKPSEEPAFLKQSSDVVRSTREGAGKILESTEKEPQILIEQITNPGDPRLQGVQDLMEATFGASELDSFEIMQMAVRDGTYIVVAGVDPKTGKVIALSTGSSLPMLDQHGSQHPSETFLCGYYIVVDPPYRDKKLSKAMFEKRLEAAKAQAVKQRKTLRGYLAEGSEAEKFFNTVFARRLYIQTSPTTYEEIPYYQPPTEWNKKGQGVKYEGDEELPYGKHDSPEHLVYAPINGNAELSPDALMQMIRGMFDYNATQNLDPGVSKKAKERAKRTVEEYEHELEAFLQKSIDGRIHPITKEHREGMKEKGVTFKEHQKH